MVARMDRDGVGWFRAVLQSLGLDRAEWAALSLDLCGPGPGVSGHHSGQGQGGQEGLRAEA